MPGFPTSQTNETSPMDASTNTTTTTTIGFSPQSQPRDNNIFSPLPPPPPPTLAAAPPLLHWPATNDTSDGGGFSSGSPLPSRDFVSYPPTTAIPKKPRTPRRKPDAASTSTTTLSNTTPRCAVCGRRFSSRKALYGHMRSHPERSWRGIVPPPDFCRPSSPAADHFSDEEYQAATTLVMLANGPPRFDQVN